LFGVVDAWRKSKTLRKRKVWANDLRIWRHIKFLEQILRKNIWDPCEAQIPEFAVPRRGFFFEPLSGAFASV